MNDIRPLGAGDGRAHYWVKTQDSLGAAHLDLIAVDERGEVTSLPLRSKWDESAATRAEAVQAHLAGAITEADRDLERRRREAAEKPKPEPMDPATDRFLSD